MRCWILALVVVLGACGSVGNAGPPSPTPAPSALRSAVERLAPALSFEAFVPDDLPPELTVTASLFAGAKEGDQQPNTLRAPLLSLQFTPAGGGKPALIVLQGPEGCCLDLPRSGPAVDTVIRPARPGIPGSAGAEMRGQFTRSPTEGPTLSWNEPTTTGRPTYITLMATRFGTQFDEQGLLRLARSMRAVDRPASTDTVFLYVSTHTSHSPNGHRVFVAPRTGPAPDEARIVDPSGAVIASARFESSAAGSSYSCLAAAPVLASLAVPPGVLGGLNIASGYRVEALAAGVWRPAVLVSSGCASIE